MLPYMSKVYFTSVSEYVAALVAINVMLQLTSRQHDYLVLSKTPRHSCGKSTSRATVLTRYLQKFRSEPFRMPTDALHCIMSSTECQTRLAQNRHDVERKKGLLRFRSQIFWKGVFVLRILRQWQLKMLSRATEVSWIGKGSRPAQTLSQPWKAPSGIDTRG